jgi:hypothetical protein
VTDCAVGVLLSLGMGSSSCSPAPGFLQEFGRRGLSLEALGVLSAGQPEPGEKS